MKDSELEALRKEIGEGFRALNDRLTAIEARLTTIEPRLMTIESGMSDGFSDTHQGLHGLMFKFLRVEEINEIRGRMKNPPDLADFPLWVLR